VSAVDTEKAESKDRNLPSDLKRKDQLYFIVLEVVLQWEEDAVLEGQAPGISAFSGCRLGAHAHQSLPVT
jgi:hypothetical protein